MFSSRFAFASDRPYTPGTVSDADLDEHLTRTGLQRLVLVQPSPYGDDNSCMLAALARLGARARAVATVPPRTPPQELVRFHSLGVRGARLNFETPSLRPDIGAARERIRELARQIAPVGWHLELYAALSLIHALADTVAELPIAVVIDHFGMPAAPFDVTSAEARTLCQLMEGGQIHVKLSAARRVADPEDPRLRDWVAMLLDAGGDRLVWGSDWPHPRSHRFAADREDTIAGLYPEDDRRILDLLANWTGSATALRRILVDTPARLYDFAEASGIDAPKIPAARI
jgi:predicted TIM-barrel fold metal-dependent hydrolase